MRHAIWRCAAGAFFVLSAGSAEAEERQGAPDGRAIYKARCATCHTVMAPRLGDKAAWAALQKKGDDALVDSTIKGKGAMPPFGGRSNLSDADIKAAVRYLETQSR